MVLVSFVLVVVAAIALVIGLLQSGLGIIYVSIACSVLAGIVLVIAVLRGRPEARPAAGPAARPAAQGAPPPPAPAPSAAETTQVSAPPAPPSPPSPPPEREPVLAGGGRAGGRAAAGTAVSDRTEQLDQVEVEEAVGVDDGFPIHDYDRLRATEILPILAELDEHQLDAVRRREQAGKNRFMILSRIDDELQSRQAEGWGAEDEGWTAEEEEEEPEVAAAAVPEPEAEPLPEPEPAPAVPLRRAARAGEFPIPDYDDLRALDILGRLNDLSADELEAVREREQAGARRAMILHRIDRLLEDAGPEEGEPGEIEPEPIVVPSGRGARARAGARAGGRTAKAPTTKRAAGAKKTAKAPAARTRAAAKTAAPVKKAAAAKKGVGKKAAVAKAPAARGRAAKAPAVKKARTTKKTAKRI
ncbi:MAG TPA: hypothetical protein VHF24_03105 [Acidimicrobiales bacterium]|nr:hypothetical protein [Acidimicrobiales bacterium]